MTTAGKHIIEDFARLPDAEKQEVLADILRMSAHLDYATVSDDELLASADVLFRDYDQRESEK